MKKRNCTLLLSAVCAAGLLFGWGMANFLAPSPPAMQRAAAERETKATPIPASAPTVGPDTRLIVRYSYGGCGHYELKEEQIPSSWRGKPISQLSLPGKIFESYENDTLYFVKISQAKCDRHFILRAEQGKLVVTYQNDPSRIRDSYDFRPQLVPAGELKKLEEGIMLESEQELTAFLEDYCS